MSPKLFNFLLVILPVVIYFGYLNPAYTGQPGLVWTPALSVTALKSQNVQYANTINQINLIEKGVMDLNKDYLAIDEATKERMEIMLPDTIDQIKLRNELIQIAAKSNVALQALKVERDLKGDKNMNFYTVSFALKARYPVFKKFMDSYESNMRFFILESASIQRQERNENDPSAAPIDDEEALIINITSRVYYMR